MSGRIVRLTGAVAVCLGLFCCAPDGAENDAEPDGRADGTWAWPIERPEPPFVLGQPAPQFTLAVLREAMGEAAAADSIRLGEHVGSVVVLDFWNTGCIPCIREHETLVKVAEDLRPRGVRFFGITHDSPASLARFVEEHGDFPYPNLHDDGAVRGSYRVPGWPTKVVIDRAGRVAWWRPGGPIPEATLVGVVEDVLADRRPDAPTHAAYPEGSG